MDDRRANQLLWLFTALAGSGEILIVLWAIRAPVTAETPVPPRGGAADARTGPGTPELPSLEEFEAVWDVRLRQPLFEPPPKPAPPVAGAGTAAPAIGIRLAGTVLESGRSIAVLLMPGGKLEIRRVGDRAGDVEILAIEADRIVVRQKGRDVTLRLEQPRKS